MKEETQVAKDVTRSADQVQYDKQAKNLLSYACIQAWILKELVTEFRDYSVQEVCSILTGKKPKGHMLDGETRLEMDKTEDTVFGGQTIHLDAYFGVTVPCTGERIHINVELQKNPLVQKWLKNRGWYYIARMTSCQSNTVFEKDRYEKIEKVYSIWIVGGSREKSRIERYSPKGKDGALDTMELIIVYLGDPEKSDGSLIERLLNTIFSATLDIEKKKKTMGEQFFIEMNRDLERTVENVCNLSQGILEMGREEGRQDAQKEIALNLSQMGLDIEKIAEATKVSIKQIREWINS